MLRKKLGILLFASVIPMASKKLNSLNMIKNLFSSYYSVREENPRLLKKMAMVFSPSILFYFILECKKKISLPIEFNEYYFSPTLAKQILEALVIAFVPQITSAAIYHYTFKIAPIGSIAKKFKDLLFVLFFMFIHVIIAYLWHLYKGSPDLKDHDVAHYAIKISFPLFLYDIILYISPPKRI